MVVALRGCQFKWGVSAPSPGICLQTLVVTRMWAQVVFIQWIPDSLQGISLPWWSLFRLLLCQPSSRNVLHLCQVPGCNQWAQLLQLYKLLQLQFAVTVQVATAVQVANFKFSCTSYYKYKCQVQLHTLLQLYKLLQPYKLLQLHTILQLYR